MNLKVLLTRNDCTIEFYIKKKTVEQEQINTIEYLMCL